MIVLLSPAKKQHLAEPLFSSASAPVFSEKSAVLAEKLRGWSIEEFQNEMKISASLAKKTKEQYEAWNIHSGTIPAVSIYSGPAFASLDPFSFTPQQLERARRQLIILSALYGVLHADTAVLPYRLEMSQTLPAVGEHLSLYRFWKESITEYLASYCRNSGMNPVINCASGEYSKAVDFEKLPVPVITCDFREMKNGEPKSVSSFAKQGRGSMARWIIQTDPQSVEELKMFDRNGYRFSNELSRENLFIFVR
jgi:uncharacterized protein